MQPLYFWKSTAQFQHIYVYLFSVFWQLKALWGMFLKALRSLYGIVSGGKNLFFVNFQFAVFVLEFQLLCSYWLTEVHELAHDHG